MSHLVHNFIHLTDDRRFSSADNFWSDVFERAIHTYVEKSSNPKNLELTFAKAESRQELFKFLSHNHTNDRCEYHTTSNGCLEQVNKISVYVHIQI